VSNAYAQNVTKDPTRRYREDTSQPHPLFMLSPMAEYASDQRWRRDIPRAIASPVSCLVSAGGKARAEP
jgi:hypothetical protein